MQRSRALARSSELVVLKVLVPKELKLQEGEANPKDFRETMSVAEQFLAGFSSLYELTPERWWYGQETISLEFVAKDGLITFYIAMPRKLQPLVERQLHSFYPYAQIEPSEDFGCSQTPCTRPVST